MKKAIIIFSNLNIEVFALASRFNVDILSEEWIKRRLDIFMKYTRVSLESQDNQNFWAFIAIHPRTVDIVNRLLKDYPPLPPNIIFTPSRVDEVAKSIEGYDYVYLIKVDSDDMYHPTYVSQMYEHKVKEGIGVIINQSGYIFNTSTGQIAHFENNSPAFYTQIFDVRSYLDVYRYYPEISHVYINRLPYEAINQSKNFIVVAHSNNIFTTFSETYKHALITDEEHCKQIKKEFKIL